MTDPIDILLYFGVFLVAAILAYWKPLKHWFMHITPSHFLNTLALVIALGVIPMFMYYSRWIVGGAFIVAILYGFVK